MQPDRDRETEREGEVELMTERHAEPYRRRSGHTDKEKATERNSREERNIKSVATEIQLTRQRQRRLDKYRVRQGDTQREKRRSTD